MVRRILVALVLTASVGSMLVTPSAADAGPLGGTKKGSDTVPVGKVDVYKVAVSDTTTVEVANQFGSAPNVLVDVYNSKGELIASGFAIGGPITCTFKTGPIEEVTIKVSNPGTTDQSYTIVVK